MTNQAPLAGLWLDGHPTWQMPELTSFGKLPPRSTFWLFPDAEAARARLPERSPLVRCLNGDWEFQVFDRPADVTADALDAGAWRRLAVPGNWTMQLRNEALGGRSFKKPHYTNIQMPFAELFPHVPEDTATGVYRTTISIPAEWAAQRIVLHFAGCEGLLYVYLDGALVGFNKDSRTAAEYEISDRVQAGGSYELLCVNPRYSDASWVEDQDHWWQAGIHRSVYLYTTPRIYLHDLTVQTELAADMASAVLRVQALIRSSGADMGVGSLRAQLYAPDGMLVFENPLESSVPGPTLGLQFGPGPRSDTATATLLATVDQPQLWSAETPALYTLVLTLEIAGSTVSTAVRIGFRKVEIRDRELRVNGQPVMIHGMNRHDHSDEYGKAVPDELMLLDARTMKAHNVNAVRASHYPNDPFWLDLCDEYGLYVVDEANIENHALLSLSEDPRVSAAYYERVRNMVERDKNHPSVIIWSLGNESGYGPNHDAAAAWVRFTDPTRPVQYEGAISPFNNDNSFAGSVAHWNRGYTATDILNPMYAPIDAIVNWVTTTDDPRPLILCEYAHAMGNSSGSLADYYAAFEQHHGLQGGFIWEWLDHGIRMQSPDGTPYWVYGGDFGDEPNDGNFVADGMVWPDRRPHPGLLEFKYLARPVRVVAVDAQQGVFRVENRRYFSDLSDLRGEWSVKVDGAIVQSGELALLDTPPQSHTEITLPMTWPDGGEAFVEFRFSAREQEPWAQVGDLVAWDQLPVSINQRDITIAQPSNLVQVTEQNGQVTLALGEQRVVINMATGELVRFGSRDLIVSGPVLSVWRAPTDNDTMQLRFGATDRAAGLWQTLGLGQLQRRATHADVVAGDQGSQCVEIVHALSGRDRWDDLTHIQRYTLLEDGTLRIYSHVRCAEGFADLPRVGLVLQLSGELEQLAWYGRGPGDTYSDRIASSMVDLYRSTVTDQYVPYIMPQEHGHKTGVRWLRLTNEGQHGLAVTSDAHFEFNALHYSDADLTMAQHTPELTPCSEVWLHLDHRMRGLGTGLVVDTLPEYRLDALEYEFTFDLKLI